MVSSARAAAPIGTTSSIPVKAKACFGCSLPILVADSESDLESLFVGCGSCVGGASLVTVTIGGVDCVVKDADGDVVVVVVVVVVTTGGSVEVLGGSVSVGMVVVEVGTVLVVVVSGGSVTDVVVVTGGADVVLVVVTVVVRQWSSFPSDCPCSSQSCPFSFGSGLQSCPLLPCEQSFCPANAGATNTASVSAAPIRSKPALRNSPSPVFPTS